MIPVLSRQVMLWLYVLYILVRICCCAIVFRTRYSAWYLVPGTTSLLEYQAVTPVTPVNYSIHNHHAPRTQNGFGRGQRWIEGVTRDLCRRHTGQNRVRVGGVRGTKLNAQTRIHRGSKNSFIKLPHAVGKDSESFASIRRLVFISGRV